MSEIQTNDTLPLSFKKKSKVSIPIEDIGVVVLDNRQITITQGLLEMLLEYNCAIISVICIACLLG